MPETLDKSGVPEAKLAIPVVPEICISRYARTHGLRNNLTEKIMQPLNCKSPKCPVHRPKWIHKWKVVIGRELDLNPVDKLITLTCAEDANPGQLYKARRFLCQLIRKDYDAFEYLSVLEFTTATRLPHLHILARAAFIPQRRLSRYWKTATKWAGIKPSPVVYIEAPRIQQAAAFYALNYALAGSKKGQEITEEYRGRKITYSKNFFIAATVGQHWQNWISETFPAGVDAGQWELIVNSEIEYLTKILVEEYGLWNEREDL